MELLDERWTLLVVRELMIGSERFNDLRRGLPRMSPTLLSRRLHQLAAARGWCGGRSRGGEVRYVLTAAGEELRPVVEALGGWGTRWIRELARPRPRPQAAAVGHAPQRRPRRVPPRRTVVRSSSPTWRPAVARWWLVMSPARRRRLRRRPGRRARRPGADLPAHADRGLARRPHLVERGSATSRCGCWPRARCARALPGWFVLSPFAAVPRPVRSLGCRP